MSVRIVPEIQDGSSILHNLPPATRCYSYKGITDYSRILRNEQTRFKNDTTRATSQYIVFSDVDERTYSHDLSHARELVDSYSPCERLVLVKITTAAQERAHVGLVSKMIQELTEMDKANRFLHMIASAQIQTPSRSKRADQEFQPRKLPPGHNRKWPTLVVEAGYADSKHKLVSDVAWWFQASGGDVKTAVIVLIGRPRGVVDIEKWESMEWGISPTLQQRVTMEANGTEAASFINAPLFLSYRNLFLEPPSEYENDVVFTEKDLQNLAKKVWEAEGGSKTSNFKDIFRCLYIEVFDVIRLWHRRTYQLAITILLHPLVNI